MQVKDWVKRVAYSIPSAIITLASLKDLFGFPQLPSGLIMSNYALLALAGVFAFPIWVAYQIGLWRSKKQIAQTGVVKTSSPSAQVGQTAQAEQLEHLSHEELVLTPRQYKYREEVRAEVLRLRVQLRDFIVRKPILFKSWNESTDPDFHNLKHQLIKIPQQDEAIEHFSTALNDRNDNLWIPKFEELNEKCIALYVKIKETGFLDTESAAKIDREMTEFEGRWHLSRDIQPMPPFGSEDMMGSDRASKLHVLQRGKRITLTGNMAKLKPSWMYVVYLAKPSVPFSLGRGHPSTIIGAEGAPYANFETDKDGSGSWPISITVDDLTRYGIIDRLQLWVNDAPKNKSVLGSDPIPIQL